MSADAPSKRPAAGAVDPGGELRPAKRPADASADSGRAAGAAPRATLLHGGCIVTCVPGGAPGAAPVQAYDWILLEGGRVLQVGTGGPPQDLSPDVTRVDLQGRLVLPGLFDSHCHVFYQGKMQRLLQLEGTKSIEELQGRLRKYHAENPLMTVIEGTQWDQELLGRFPCRGDLDIVSVPVIIHRRCWHVCCLNSAALALCGVQGGEAVPGGQVDVDERGVATGVLREAAIDRFTKPLKQAGSAEDHKSIIKEGLDIFLRHGCTSVLTNDGREIGGLPEAAVRYQEMAGRGELPIRVFLTVDWKELEEAKAMLGGAAVPLSRLSVFRVKLWTDGALGASTAALEEPYSDDPEGANRGILQIEPSEMRRAVALAQAAGFGVEAHTIGDRSARLLLDAFEEMGVDAARRYTLTHCQILNADLRRRMARLGVVASVQPQFATSDAAIAPLRLGAESDRLRNAYAWRDLLTDGVRLAGGSDAPVETPDPLEGIYRAMANDVHASQSLSFAQALEMYTLGGAYAAFREGDLGALAPGYRADLVITSLRGGLASAQDPAAFHGARVEEVWVDGVAAYVASAPETAAPGAPGTAPEGPGKCGLALTVRRGPCPCCGPRWPPDVPRQALGSSRRLRV